MCLLFETIRIEAGVPQNLTWHQKRMDFAMKQVWKIDNPVKLDSTLKIPEEYAHGRVRCKVLYGRSLDQVSFSMYKPKVIRSLKIVEDNQIDYQHKYADRSGLDSLFRLRGSADEIVIVKDGVVTDTSVSNLIFLETGTWYTPSEPLLKGTTRSRLLSEGLIRERRIRTEDLNKYEGCKLINAMRDLREEPLIPIDEIT